MAAVLPDIVDRIISLMTGAQSSVTRSITAGDFKHVPFDPQYALPATTSSPYPFEVEDGGEFQPADVPSTICPSQVWHGAELIIRVGYMASPHNQLERMKTIQTDRYKIRRCLGDPDSFDGVTGFSSATLDDGVLQTARLPGSDNDDVDVMLLLEVPCSVVYREDHTS